MIRVIAVLLAASLAGASETYVLAVGIDRYDRDWAVAPLSYAANDAVAVARAFRGAGVPERNVRLLTSRETVPLQRPTGANILDLLSRLARRCDPGDTLVFMFSGHGLQVGGVSYLLPVESDLDHLDRTALPLDDVRLALEQAQGANVLLLIDACRNEPRKARGAGNALLDGEFAKGVRPRRVPGAAVILACDVGQRAWEDPETHHGAFTAVLLRGLAGPLRSGDGSVRLSRLVDYLARAVPEWASRNGRQQTPRFDGPVDLDFVVLPPRPNAVRELPLVSTLKVTSLPAGAAVAVEGKPLGKTPLLVRLPLPDGQSRRVTVEVALAGYQRRAADVGLMPGGFHQWLNVALDRVGVALPPRPGPALGFALPGYLGRWRAELPAGLRYRLRAADGMPQVLIPAGEFGMGSPDGQGSAIEHPRKRVSVGAFWMDLHPVTVAQFERYCSATSRPMPG
ncbi:MAG: caspase family protein, partial [Armatimonadetes bacterium]|nr:caspase family protein [Armatimonadota bacterium]